MQDEKAVELRSQRPGQTTGRAGGRRGQHAFLPEAGPRGRCWVPQSHCDAWFRNGASSRLVMSGPHGSEGSKAAASGLEPPSHASVGPTFWQGWLKYRQSVQEKQQQQKDTSRGHCDRYYPFWSIFGFTAVSFASVIGMYHVSALISIPFRKFRAIWSDRRKSEPSPEFFLRPSVFFRALFSAVRWLSRARLRYAGFSR